MEIKVLGTGCAGCKSLHETVNQAVADLEISATIVKEEDLEKIMSYDILSMPGLVIDEKVVSAGRNLSLAEVKSLLRSKVEKSIEEQSCPCGANYFCKCE